jgi:hypothetical protein
VNIERVRCGGREEPARPVEREEPSAADRRARTLLGLAFVVFSANYFFPFLPQPPVPQDARAFVIAFEGAGFLTFIKVFEMAAGLALIF